jgi:tripartite-type tricarboxylate transporter receptor subunit TctC
MPAVLPFIKRGKLVPLAVTSKARSESAREIPTVAESGIPSLQDFAVENYYGLMAPAKTPKAVLDKIEADVTAVLNTPELKAKFSSAGLDVFMLKSTDMNALLKNDVAKYRKAATTAGIKPE